MHNYPIVDCEQVHKYVLLPRSFQIEIPVCHSPESSYPSDFRRKTVRRRTPKRQSFDMSFPHWAFRLGSNECRMNVALIFSMSRPLAERKPREETSWEGGHSRLILRPSTPPKSASRLRVQWTDPRIANRNLEVEKCSYPSFYI